ncbi:hypothetical protein PRIPAC_74721 [Pristionchus pacificus]|uniref:Uncharacterized protein n=1 Tax=Pristionchus pacificus TaxID=54126 RepID=A0A2A6C908_PRIPA|nr:hypothetical protein PRIPAC_74721 [Pristionchus pacificus]|eukprot:PDM74597.1 hypothetical protein PRIPAC_41953 [Pristionchus pacificus]
MDSPCDDDSNDMSALANGEEIADDKYLRQSKRTCEKGREQLNICGVRAFSLEFALNMALSGNIYTCEGSRASGLVFEVSWVLDWSDEHPKMFERRYEQLAVFQVTLIVQAMSERGKSNEETAHANWPAQLAYDN